MVLILLIGQLLPFKYSKLDRAKVQSLPVRNRNNSPLRKDIRPQRLLHHLIRDMINSTRRLVQHKHLAAGQQSAC